MACAFVFECECGRACVRADNVNGPNSHGVEACPPSPPSSYKAAQWPNGGASSLIRVTNWGVGEGRDPSTPARSCDRERGARGQGSHSRGGLVNGEGGVLFLRQSGIQIKKSTKSIGVILHLLLFFLKRLRWSFSKWCCVYPFCV